VALALALSVPQQRVAAQSGFETAIEQYSATALRGYLRPLSDVLVANLAGGYHNGAMIPGGGITFSVEFVGSLAKIANDLRSYTAELPPGFDPSTYETPTIFGGTAPTVNHATIDGVSYRGSDGLINGDYFPAALPQVRVGGLFGSELVVRWMSSSLISILDEEDFPELTIFGAGVRHSISQYFPGWPVAVSVGGSYNSLTFGDIVDLRGVSLGVQVARNVGVLGLYGGLASDGGAMTVKYTSTDPSEGGAVSVDLDSERAVRFTVGAALNVPVFKLFADATFGGVSTFAFGFRVGN
jgi:hypothetical protein